MSYIERWIMKRIKLNDAKDIERFCDIVPAYLLNTMSARDEMNRVVTGTELLNYLLRAATRMRDSVRNL